MAKKKKTTQKEIKKVVMNSTWQDFGNMTWNDLEEGDFRKARSRKLKELNRIVCRP